MANINYTKPNKLEDFSAWCSKKYPLWCKSNFPFIENTFEALDTYGLICKIVQYLNEVKQNLNTTEDNVQNIYNFVTNYFDNLDVQNEINNKLDEMASSGVLQEIISSYLQTQAIFAYNNVEDMKNAENLIEGSFAKTLGYYSINDGGSANYKIRNRTFNDIIDNGSIILMTNENLVAELIKDETLNFKQFGVKFDGITDSTNQMQNALNYGKTNIKGCNGIVCISSPLTITSTDEKIYIDFKEMTIKCIANEIINHVLKIESGNNLRVAGKIQNLNIDSQGKSKVGLYVNDTIQFNIDNIEITSSTEADFLIDRKGITEHATVFLNDARLICGHEKGFPECANANAIQNYAHDNHFENVVTLGYIKHIITTTYGLFNKVHSWNYKDETINNSSMFLSRGGQTSATDCYADTLETMFEMEIGTSGTGSLDAVNSIFYLNPSFYKDTHNVALPIKVSDEFVSNWGRIRMSGGRFGSITGRTNIPFINYDTSKANFRQDLLRLNNIRLGNYTCSKYFYEYSDKDLTLTPATLTENNFYLKKATTTHGLSVLNFGATLKGVTYGSYFTVATITDSDFVVKTEESYPMQFFNNYKDNECVVGLAKITTNKELQIRIPVTEGWSDTASIGMLGTMLNIVK